MISYKDGNPNRIVDFGEYNGMSCLEICSKDKKSRGWQKWACDKTNDDQLRADLQQAMIVFLEKLWKDKRGYND